MTALILFATLRPSSDTSVYDLPALCILCGARGASDALANVILFVPFGALLALAVGGRHALRLAGAGCALSLMVESAQTMIPGRDPSIGDLLFNTLGTWLGATLVLRAAWWVVPPPRVRGGLLAAGLAAAVVLALAAGVLFEPVGTGATYYGQWTPEQRHLERYHGRVLEVTVGGLPVADGPISETPLVRERLLGGEPVRVLAVAGPPVSGLASLFSVMDANRQEILLIGPDRGGDLVVRRRLRGAELLLDGPHLRLRGALAGFRPGDTLRVALWREPAGHCVEVNGVAECGLGFTVGRGWSLVMFPDRLPAWAQRLLDLVWLAGIAAPAGFWAVRRGETAVAVLVVVAVLLGVPAVTELLPTPPTELAAGVAGVLAGAAVGRYARSARRVAASG